MGAADFWVAIIQLANTIIQAIIFFAQHGWPPHTFF